MEGREPPLAVWTLLVVLAQLAGRALIGGAALVVAPSGAIIGLSPTRLAGTPFETFLWPGLILAGVLGVYPAVVGYAVYTRRWWGWLAGLSVAVALLGWLLVEMLVGYARPTVWLNLATAVAILWLARHPAVRGAARDRA
jgi:hypothetical protein